MKVAVTGSTGFIGRFVVRELIDRGVETVAISRKKTSPCVLRADDCLSHIFLDISDPPSDPYRYIGEPDILIHLAWGGLPNYRSLHHFETELPNHYFFLKRMLEGGLRNLVVSGTSFEYGKQSGELHEGLPTLPCTPYGLAKDILRKAIEFLKNSHDFSFTWARLFYIYGDGQAESTLYSQLKKAVESGERFFNMSRGEQLRDYLPVQQVATYIVDIALKRGDFGVVNVCSGIPVSIRSLVEGWIREKNWKIELNLGYYPYPDYEPIAFWGSTEKLKKVLGDDF